MPSLEGKADLVSANAKYVSSQDTYPSCMVAKEYHQHGPTCAIQREAVERCDLPGLFHAGYVEISNASFNPAGRVRTAAYCHAFAPIQEPPAYLSGKLRGP